MPAGCRPTVDGLHLLARREIHDGHRAGDGKSIFPVDDDRRAVGIVGEVFAGGGASAFVADIGILAMDDHAVRRIADRNLGDELGRRGGQVDHAERVGHVQRHIGALAVFGDRDAARVDGFRVVIRPAIRRRIGQIHALPVGQKARLRVHIRDDDVVVVLAEEQLLAVRGIGDAGEGPRFAGDGFRASHKRGNEALKNLSGHGIEHDDRLGRTHQQDGAAIGLGIRIERNGLGAHRRAEFNDLAGGRQRLVVRRDDRPILLRANGAIGMVCGSEPGPKLRLNRLSGKSEELSLTCIPHSASASLIVLSASWIQGKGNYTRCL